jgi:hypothetical protein
VNRRLPTRPLSLWKGALAAIATLAAVFVPAARAADEDGLVALWKQHMQAGAEHEAVIAACRAFAATHANDLLLPVARGIEAWRTLRAGNREAAFALYEADLALPPAPVNDCARRLASGWLTRADREKIDAALHAYYRKEIAYPKELAQLASHPRFKKEPRLPEVDRFGKPWSYTLTSFEKFKGLADQRYALRSAVLGELSELKAAEALPYAGQISAVPLRVIAMPDNTSAVSFRQGATTALSLLGPGAGELHLAFVGAKIIVVCDHTHWKLLPRP